MTQEEKQLLLKDLCARLPYGVMCDFAYNLGNPQKLLYVTPYDEKEQIHLDAKEYKFGNGSHGPSDFDIEEVKPYLRPMSSMTKDEREEIEVFIFNEWYEEDSCKIDKEGWIEILANYDVSGIDPCFCSDYVDWLNEHHFDYRGLIEKSLAIVAPDNMYK